MTVYYGFIILLITTLCKKEKHLSDVITKMTKKHSIRN